MAFWETTFGLIVKTFLISMVPVVELRGAVPIAVHDGLNIWLALGVSVVGNLVPVPFIILFVRDKYYNKVYIQNYFYLNLLNYIISYNIEYLSNL